MLEFTRVDLARLDTLMKMFRRGKYELEGEEVLAFAQAYAWAITTVERIKVDLETPPPVEVVPEVKAKGRK